MKAKTSATSRIEAINDSDYPFSDPKCQPDDIARRDSSLLQGDSAESFFDFASDAQSSNGVMIEEEILKEVIFVDI